MESGWKFWMQVGMQLMRRASSGRGFASAIPSTTAMTAQERRRAQTRKVDATRLIHIVEKGHSVAASQH
ncbi:hypothetical protein CK223_33100 [Mesorhizobium loti]|nr:hypothetical protein CK223_33100 [Mesorhizobium loti]